VEDFMLRPALIAQCSATSDVVACIEFARAEGMPVSVRGGGTASPARPSATVGLVIDLSGMKGIEIDTSRRTALAQTGLEVRPENLPDTAKPLFYLIIVARRRCSLSPRHQAVSLKSAQQL